MERITFFESVRSLLDVASDVAEAVIVEAEGWLDKAEGFIENLEEQAPQEPQAKPAPTREEKAWSIVAEWNRRGTHFGAAWRPTSPQFKDVPDYLIDDFYTSLLNGTLP